MQIITLIIIFIVTLIYFSRYNLKMFRGDLTNYMVGPLYHANMSHLLANMTSLFFLSRVEQSIGWGTYIEAILFIWVVSSLLLFTLHNLVPAMKVKTVGFSGIIFGLIVVNYVLSGMRSTTAAKYLILSIIPQIMIPNISVEGHFCGILAGLIYVKWREQQLKYHKMIR